MNRVLSLLLLTCAVGCSDADSRSSPVVTDASSGETRLPDAGGFDNPPSEVLPPATAKAGPMGTIIPANFETSCERDGKVYKLGEWHFDHAACASLLCTRTGWDNHPAFCDQGTECDGGPCEECELGSQHFPLGTGFVCPDGCNHCTCTGFGRWIQTLLACGPLPAIAPCTEPPANDTTRAVYLAGDGSALGLRAEFGLGGCTQADLIACYAFAPNGAEPPRARIWLEPRQRGACTIPFVGEAVFSLKPLAEQDPREHGTIELQIGEESIAYEF